MISESRRIFLFLCGFRQTNSSWRRRRTSSPYLPDLFNLGASLADERATLAPWENQTKCHRWLACHVAVCHGCGDILGGIQKYVAVFSFVEPTEHQLGLTCPFQLFCEAGGTKRFWKCFCKREWWTLIWSRGEKKRKYSLLGFYQVLVSYNPSFLFNPHRGWWMY